MNGVIPILFCFVFEGGRGIFVVEEEGQYPIACHVLIEGRPCLDGQTQVQKTTPAMVSSPTPSPQEKEGF